MKKNEFPILPLIFLVCFLLISFQSRATRASDDIANHEETVSVQAAEIYETKELKKFFLGKHYREAWTTPIDVPVLDLSKEVGGLTIIKRGGGKQMKSLRLKGKDGKQYVIRSIQKFPAPLIPRPLRKTFIADIVQDQISAGHPYGAFVIPKLADAAGVYHTNPKLVFVPDTPLLGEHRAEFANMLVLFEERPDEDQSDVASFGYAKNVVGSAKMRDKVLGDSDNDINQKAFARARLFDMLIGDWDRHYDQWRWAEFDKDGKGKVYEPIPRDRDQVFFKFDGVLPWVMNRRFALRELQTFDYKIRDIKGLNFQARFLDHFIFSELTLEDWLAIADDIKQRLTDEVIESAFLDWPDKIYDLDAEEIISKLKSRRDRLPEYARKYYLIIAREVEVLGTQKHELFKVLRLNNDETSVALYNINKEGKKGDQTYSRTFNTKETREIRLYGISGYNIYHLSGEVDKGIVVRIVGGGEKDRIIDDSRVRGTKNHTVVYDTKKGNEFEIGREAKERTADDHIEYFNNNGVYTLAFGLMSGARLLNPQYMYYDYLLPLVSFGLNDDDGFFVGGGVRYVRHGFRRLPYASSHTIVGNVAFATGAFNFKYRGDFKEVLGAWDANLDLLVFGPNYVNNYFGISNETPLLTDDKNFNRIRINQVIFYPALKSPIGEDHSIKIGPEYQYTEVDRTEGRFSVDPASGLIDEDFDTKHFIGVTHRKTAMRESTSRPPTIQSLNLSSLSKT